MSKRKGPAAGWQMVGLACNLVAGFVVGLLAPVAGLAGMVGGVYLLTGKVPFLGHIYEDEAGRHLSFKLVPPDEVGTLASAHKEQVAGDLIRMKQEFQAMAEQAKAEATQAAPVVES